MFDKIKFAKVLNDINDTYDTMTEFSEKSGVNRTYLSQYINMKLDNPPTPKILGKISDASNGITTYEELMLICGYINKSMEFSELAKKIFNKYLPSLKELNLNEDLLDIMYKMSIEPSKYSKDFDKLVFKLPKKIQDKVYDISSKILSETSDMMRNTINNISIMTKYNYENAIDLDEADIAFASGVKALNETNKMIIKNTLEALLAKQEKDEENKEEK